MIGRLIKGNKLFLSVTIIMFGLFCLVVYFGKNQGNYKRSGTKSQRYFANNSKMSSFLWLYLNSISLRYKGKYFLETP